MPGFEDAFSPAQLRELDTAAQKGLLDGTRHTPGSIYNAIAETFATHNPDNRYNKWYLAGTLNPFEKHIYNMTYYLDRAKVTDATLPGLEIRDADQLVWAAKRTFADSVPAAGLEESRRAVHPDWIKNVMKIVAGSNAYTIDHLNSAFDTLGLSRTSDFKVGNDMYPRVLDLTSGVSRNLDDWSKKLQFSLPQVPEYTPSSEAQARIQAIVSRIGSIDQTTADKRTTAISRFALEASHGLPEAEELAKFAKEAGIVGSPHSLAAQDPEAAAQIIHRFSQRGFKSEEQLALANKVLGLTGLDSQMLGNVRTQIDWQRILGANPTMRANAVAESLMLEPGLVDGRLLDREDVGRRFLANIDRTYADAHYLMGQRFSKLLGEQRGLNLETDFATRLNLGIRSMIDRVMKDELSIRFPPRVPIRR